MSRTYQYVDTRMKSMHPTTSDTKNEKNKFITWGLIYFTDSLCFSIVQEI